MKRIFTLLLVFTVAFTFAQKNAENVTVENNQSTAFSKIEDLELLQPGNWENATSAVTYTWGAGNGYIFGTNTYGDQAYGQIFEIDSEHTIGGAIYWIGAKSGTEGDVIFTLWDYSGGTVGDVLASKTISMADITAAENFADALIVTFDDPVTVTGDFVIGADLTGLNAYADGSYYLGNVSSQDGDGAEAALAIVKETTGWGDVLGYDVDVDIAIFPFLADLGTVDTYTVTFNVDMNDVEGFDPAEDKVFLTGTLTGWAEPGTENSIELTRKVDAKSAHVLFEDNFEDGTLDAWVEIIEGDGVYGDDDDGLAHWHVRDWDQTGDPLEGQTKIMRCSWGYDIDTWAITPLIEDLPANAVFSFWYNASYHWNVDPNPNGLLTVKVSTDGGDNWDVIWNWQEIGVWVNWEWYHVELPLDDYVGDDIHVAFHMLADDNGTTTIDLVSLSVAEESDEVFFTATVAGVEPGELQYKYFSDAFVGEGEQGWAGGEWEGDPNRSVVISGDVTLDDVWGDQPSSIVENELTVQGINLFPNPVRNTLYVENTDRINQIRIFDLTGRMVYNQMVNDNTTSVNVSEFTKGVYIMQVMTVSGVTSKKFNVVK